MRPLSCESWTVALECAASLLGMSQTALERTLKAIPPGALVALGANDWEEPHVSLTKKVLDREPGSLPEIPEVLWFHATRTRADSSFAEGLLPTDLALPRLEAHINQIASRVTATGEPCIDSGAAARLDAKRKGGPLAGPFAFLIREVATNPPSSRAFTKRAPEAVEELAYEVDPARSQAIVDAYVAETRPCVVWFVSREKRSELLSRALYYIHLKLHGDVDIEAANTCYAGSGSVVPVNDIRNVEFL